MHDARHMIAGDVWLAGAGPGDVDLLTLKAARLVGEADIIFHDALVGEDILHLARADAQLVHVGKRRGRHSMPQGAINDCLVEAAHSGLKVLRLKGGDPAIFGRAAEEISALREKNIPVHIVPGITAASAAAAAAGVPLTLRGASRGLTYVTAHVSDTSEIDVDWASLADPAMTLAIYMGKATAKLIAAHLLAAGMAGDTAALVVENASRANQKICPTHLAAIADGMMDVLGSGPAVLLIGAAVAMPERAVSLLPEIARA
jgi:uroporphyrin-III C-methyltransferase